MNFYATGTTNNDNGKAKILILSFDKEGNDLAKTSSKGYETYEYLFKFTYPEEFQDGIRVDSYHSVLLNYNYNEVSDKNAS